MMEFAGRQIPTELKEIVDPAKTVLLVWDMQNDQAGGSFNKAELIRDAPPLIAAAATLPLWGTGPSPTPTDLALILFLGVFQLALAYVCFARGLTGVTAVEASLLMLLEPVLNPIWTWLVVRERPGPWALAGGAVVLAATAWRTVVPALGAARRSTG